MVSSLSATSKPAVVSRPIPMGTHHPDGIFVMVGPGVRPTSGADMSIVDTTAVVVHALGLDIPSDIEGKIPADLYTSDWLEWHPVTFGTATIPVAAQAAGDARTETAEANDEQREDMLQQLRLLGYIED